LSKWANIGPAKWPMKKLSEIERKVKNIGKNMGTEEGT